MARYVTTVSSPWAAEDAFAYMADLANFAEWDPGVRSVRQSAGTGGGPDAVFDVTVAGFPKDLVLRYRTTRFDPPREVVAVAKSRLLTSEDTITVRPTDAGCEVTYDARLTLNGVLGVADLGLRLVFGRIGDRAAAGLRHVLEAAPVTDPR